MRAHQVTAGAILLPLLLATGLASTAGCDPGAGNRDAGDLGDAGPTPRIDTDGDGLCDDTEARYGADPLSPDTDGDGLPDRAEVQLGYDPTRPSEPERELLVYLREVPGGRVTFPVQIALNGSGESYAGAFDSLLFDDPLGRVAGDYYVGSAAVAANPPDHVFEVVSEAERFDSVTGRTLLLFEIYFAFGDDIPHGCARAYPFRYYVKRVEDGRYVAVRAGILLVLPEGERPDSARWCPPITLCI